MFGFIPPFFIESTFTSYYLIDSVFDRLITILIDCKLIQLRAASWLNHPLKSNCINFLTEWKTPCFKMEYVEGVLKGLKQVFFCFFFVKKSLNLLNRKLTDNSFFNHGVGFISQTILISTLPVELKQDI